MKKPIRVLLIEDNENDAILEIDALKKGGFDVIHSRIDNPKDLKKALEDKNWDCIISDYALPLFTGIDALAEFRETGIDIPFLIVSGAIGEESAVKAMKAGVHDCIMKSDLHRLVPALERELREADIRRKNMKAEETMKFERVLLRTLIDNLPMLIFVKDIECRRIVSNKADTEFAGFEREEELIGKNDIDVFKNEFGKRSHAADMMVMQTGQPQVNYEEEMIDPEGNHRWYSISKIPMHDSLGNITGLVGIAYDITDRKKMELSLMESEQNLKKQNFEFEALNKEYISLNEEITESLERIKKMNDDLVSSKNKAEESDRLKSSFLANMSHEIRTPLNAILGFASFLRNPELSKNRLDEFVDIIDSSGRQLLSIITDILEISQIESGHISMNRENVNITKLLNELFIQFKKEASAKNIDLVLNINNSAEDIITRTDGNKVRQVLSNLLSNAVKFTHEGRIEFAARIAKNQVVLYVKDTGIGILPENQAIIFEPFRQVETTITRNYGGNGLGLSISRALVEKLGGKISVNSVPRKGSTFSFTIPYTSEPQQPEESTRKDLTVKYDWKEHTILVAEDEIYNFRFIEEMLSSTSAHVLHARDGKEAVELVKQHPGISLVIMDIKMPEMDGYQATEIIKKIRPRLPVIAQTATVLNDNKEEVSNAGFDEYLSKPIEMKEFMEVIDTYLV